MAPPIISSCCFVLDSRYVKIFVLVVLLIIITPLILGSPVLRSREKFHRRRQSNFEKKKKEECHTARAYPGFCSMRQVKGLFIHSQSPLNRTSVHCSLGGEAPVPGCMLHIKMHFKSNGFKLVWFLASIDDNEYQGQRNKKSS